MMTYQLLANGCVKRSDGLIIPNDARNHDWRVYQAWVKAGNTASPATALPAPGPDINDLLGRLTVAQQRQLFSQWLDAIPGLTAAQKAALSRP